MAKGERGPSWDFFPGMTPPTMLQNGPTGAISKRAVWYSVHDADAVSAHFHSFDQSPSNSRHPEDRPSFGRQERGVILAQRNRCEEVGSWRKRYAEKTAGMAAGR